MQQRLRRLDEHVASVELLNILRPVVAIAWYITFAAHALHQHPLWRSRIQAEPGDASELFVQEVRRFYPFTPFVGARVRTPFASHGHRFRPHQLVLLDVYGTTTSRACGTSRRRSPQSGSADDRSVSSTSSPRAAATSLADMLALVSGTAEGVAAVTGSGGCRGPCDGEVSAMRAVAWHGRRDVRVDTVPDPRIEAPTDAIVEVTSSGICGSDLHLYEVLGMWLERGDILGHEAMGIVREVGPDVGHIAPGDRVVIPFNISCGHCFMCDRGLFAQCETTQVREHGKGAALFGYTKLYGHVPGGQAEYLRVPQAQFGPIRVPHEHPDERFLYLSDILPTAWQAVTYAEVPKGGSIAVFGLGPVGQLCTRVARHLGAETVIGIDRVPERLAMARRHDVTVVDASSGDDKVAAVMDLTGGRGADGVVDAVGMEAHGSPLSAAAQKASGFLPDRLAAPLTKRMGVDRMSALRDAFTAVRRGGTVSIIGVYGGQTDPFPMMDLFDKGVQLRMGQAHVRRWTDEILPLLLGDADVLGTEDLCTHPLPLEQAPHGYEIFQTKQEGAMKVVLKPGR